MYFVSLSAGMYENFALETCIVKIFSVTDESHFNLCSRTQKNSIFLISYIYSLIHVFVIILLGICLKRMVQQMRNFIYVIVYVPIHDIDLDKQSL